LRISRLIAVVQLYFIISLHGGRRTRAEAETAAASVSEFPAGDQWQTIQTGNNEETAEGLDTYGERKQCSRRRRSTEPLIPTFICRVVKKTVLKFLSPHHLVPI
jgi:hypothetical protein